MRLTTTAPVTISQIHKRSSKGSTYKKFLINQKSINGLRREVLRETLANNHSDVLLDSEDSEDYLYNSSVPHLSAFKLTSSQKRPVDNSFTLNSKRHREVEGKEYDLDEAYSFPVSHVTLPNSNSICAPGNMQTSVPSASKAIRRSLVPTKRLSAPVTLTSQLSSTSRNGKVALQILNQPEQQHRARYQTEGSRGAVKDRTGNSFPVVKVTGYNKPATLQVFIGSDQGRVTPHMFYQACRVTGKNSTPCVEKNVEGTLVIEIDIEPSKEMTVTCDCVGILKERNVDVEHRFPEECSSRSKKKSTRCRMVFRTVITNDDGSTETLQIASQPIACTQPPGIPEICKKSLTHCAASGGKELFVLGKNFLKDTQVRFYTDDWEQTVTPDKEFLQQTHLVCVVPAYRNLDISEPAVGKVAIVSGNRSSEPHSFTFTPIVPIASSSTTNRSPDKPTTCNRLSPIINERLDSGILKSAATTADSSSDSDSGLNKTTESGVIKKCNSSSDNCENVNPAVMLWPTSNDVSSITTRNCTYNVLQNANSKTMTSPTSLLRSSAIPLGRRSSTQMIVASSVCSGPTSATASTDVLSNISSAATRSPCQSTGGMMSRYPDAASVPNYFQATERAMSEYASSTAAYRNVALSDIVDPLSLKSSVVVPKLEPRCDTSYQSQAAFPPAEFSCGGVRASLTSPPVVRCTSSASDLYSKSQSAYSAAASVSATTSSAADLYGSGKPVGVVENLTTFGVGSGGGGGNGVGADPCGVLSTGGDCSSSPLSTSSVEQSAYTSALVNGDGERRGFIKSEELSGMATLAGESAYDEINAAAAADLKNKSYQLDQMFDMKSKTPEQQQQARYENLQAASSICFKNTLMEMNQAPSNPTMSSYHQNYRNFATGDESSASSDAEMSSKLAVSQQPTTVIDSSSMLLGASAMTCVESSPSSAMILNDSKSTTSPMVVAGNVAMSPTQSAPFSLDSCTFMNAAAVAQRRQPIGNGSLVDGVNSMISVPKLEELVNKAAENHIRSASMNSLALLGPDHSANNRSAAAPNTMPYGMFTPSPSPSLSSSSSSQLNEPTFNCSPPVAVSSDKGCGVLSNTVSSLLSPYRQLTPSVCGKLSSTSDQLVQAKNIGHIANNADKLDNVAGLIKKPDDAVFAPEINRMTANDLLSYLNPSCFDQVGLMTSIVSSDRLEL